MSRLSISLIARVLGIGAAVLLLAAPAQSAPVTFHFSGAADLSAAGLPGLSSFSGFLTWESTAAPFESEPRESVYDVLAYQLIFRGVDVTLPIVGHGDGSGIAILRDQDAFEDGVFVDAFAFFASIPSALPGGGDIIFIGALSAPAGSMFGTTALPADLGFLSLVTDFRSAFLGPGGVPGEDNLLAFGSLRVTPRGAVPEPAALALTAFGVAGALARRRAQR